jgi:ribosomal protein S18 acetylase RimI-like enzyme
MAPAPQPDEKGLSVPIRALTPDDAPALTRFFAAIPEADRSFFKEDVGDPTVARRWIDDDRGVRLVAEADGAMTGIVAVWPGVGRASHVGDLRLVVAADCRRRGLGGDLARRAVADALRRGLTKMTVEVASEQQGTIDMFLAMGFRAEALLCDQLRDADGAFHDVVLLAHLAEDMWAEMLTTGLDESMP